MTDRTAAQIVAQALAAANEAAERRDAHGLVPGAHPGPYTVNDGHEIVSRFKCLECGEDHRVYPEPEDGSFHFRCDCDGPQEGARGG